VISRYVHPTSHPLQVVINDCLCSKYTLLVYNHFDFGYIKQSSLFVIILIIRFFS